MRHALAQLLWWSSFYYLLPAVLPHLMAAIPGAAGLVPGAMSAGFLLWAVLCPFAGGVVDRGGAARAMRLAGLLGAALLLVAAGAGSLWVLCFALLLMGGPMAMTLYDPCFSAMVRRFGTQARGPITMITLIAGLATLLTFPLVAGLGALGLGWRATLVVFAALALLGVLILPSDDAAGQGDARDASGPPHTGTTVTTGGRTVTLGLAFALLMFGHAALLFQLPAQLAEVRGLSGALLLPMVLGPAQIAGRLLWERLAKSLPVELGALGLFAVMLLPPLILMLGGGLGLALIALLVQGACYGVHTILRPLLAVKWMPGSGFARRLGVIAMIGLLFMGAAPAVGAWAVAKFEVGGLLGAVLLADLLGLVLLAGLILRARRGAWA